MSLYAIADLHLSLADTVDKPMDLFGPDWADHANRLRTAWLDIVKSDDVVLVPGDISWAISLEEADTDLRFVDSLPGKKIFLKGNHDYWWASMKKMRGKYATIEFIQNDIFEGPDYVVAGTRGWYLPWHPNKEYTAEESAKVYAREKLRLEMSLSMAEKVREGKKLIVMSHFPPLDRLHTGTEITEIYQKYKVDIALYGHLHGKDIFEAAEGKIGGIEYRLVSLDKLDATPVKIL